MEEEKTEGLLLQAIPILGNQKIIKVLTSHEGLVSLIVKSKTLLPFTTPFLIAEWVFTKGKKEIHSLKDATLLNDLSFLKKDYPTISTAGQIAQNLLKSQFPEKKGGGLYPLILAYLQKLPQFTSKETLLASFRLKLLMHDGLLSLQNECSYCGATASFLNKGESCCKTHTMIDSIHFSPSEWETLHLLTFARKFHPLQNITLGEGLQGRIEQLFNASFG